ncbi:MAG: hypothetical protein IKT84_02785 [Bacteroidales bacterium]|nr:hypothetical protein [Bacteroidales bacterium]MBR5831803.1 hypothetical protein [Bacteroidales bacterium]
MAIKRISKNVVYATLIIGLMSICSVTTTSCSSSKGSMYKTDSKSSSMVHKTYRVKGNKKKNSSTYRSY